MLVPGDPSYPGVREVRFARVGETIATLRDPKGKAPWYNGPGVGLYVSGMMVAAFALRGLGT